MANSLLALPGGYRNTYGGPVDEYYLFRASETQYRYYASTTEANTTVPSAFRLGRTVNIQGEEYWWKAGVTDGDLVLKLSASNGTIIDNQTTSLYNAVVGGTYNSANELTTSIPTGSVPKEGFKAGSYYYLFDRVATTGLYNWFRVSVKALAIGDYLSSNSVVALENLPPLNTDDVYLGVANEGTEQEILTIIPAGFQALTVAQLKGFPGYVSGSNKVFSISGTSFAWVDPGTGGGGGGGGGEAGDSTPLADDPSTNFNLARTGNNLTGLDSQQTYKGVWSTHTIPSGGVGAFSVQLMGMDTPTLILASGAELPQGTDPFEVAFFTQGATLRTVTDGGTHYDDGVTSVNGSRLRVSLDGTTITLAYQAPGGSYTTVRTRAQPSVTLYLKVNSPDGSYGVQDIQLEGDLV